MAFSGGRHVHLGPAGANGLYRLHDHLKVHFVFREAELLPEPGVFGDHQRLALMGQSLPYLLGNEGHEGVQQLEYLRQNVQQNALCALLCRRVLSVEAGLGQLDIPIAVAVPDEVIDLAGGDAQLEAVHIVADFLYHLIEL